MQIASSITLSHLPSMRAFALVKRNGGPFARSQGNARMPYNGETLAQLVDFYAYVAALLHRYYDRRMLRQRLEMLEQSISRDGNIRRG